MNYYMPVKIFEEENAVRNHKELLNSLGTKALIVSGRTSAVKCGALDDITIALDSLGISHICFNEVEENPSTDTIIDATKFGLDAGADFVIGIGGGSPMDAAKAIALLMAHPGAGLDYLYDASQSATALPVVCIPTTCGTGSEATGISVLTRHDNNSKGSIPHRIYPKIAFVDYRYLRALPKSVLHSSAIDALCHAVESYINKKSTAYSSLFAFEAMTIFGKALPLLDSDCNDELLSNLIHASTLAGMAIAHTGTSIPHALSYRLTYNDGTAHGTACAYFLADFVRQSPDMYRNKILELMGIDSIDDFSRLIESVCDFSLINADSVAASKKEIGANPAKMGTAPFEFLL